MAKSFLTPINLNKNEIRNVVIHVLASEPSSPVEGQTYYDSTLNVQRFYDGSAWVDMAGGAPDSEATQDIVGAMVTGNTETGITVTYEDTDGTLDFVVTDSPLLGGQNSAYHLARANHTGTQTASTISDFAEAVSDQLGTMITANTETGITVTYDDADNTLDFAVTDSPLLGGQNSAYHLARANHTGTQAPATINFAATDRLLGRDTASGGTGEEITVGGGIEFTGSGGIQRSAFSGGDVTGTAGSAVLTIGNSTVSLAKMANLAANTIIGNNTGGATTPLALTTAQVKTMLAIVPGDITGFDTQVRTSRLDQMAAPTASVSMNSQKITNVLDGTNPQDAATFGQLSAAVQSFDWKEPVKAATTANIATLAGGAPSTLDGVALALNDRILVKDQSTGGQNGIYTVTTVGSGANGTWARAADMDIAGEADNATVLVEAGTISAGDVYTQTATIATLGTTAMVWTKVAEGNTLYAADGTTLTLTGTTFSITAAGVTATQLAASVAGNGLTGGAGTALAVGAGTGITVNANDVAITAGGVTETQLATSVAGNGLAGGGGTALSVNVGTGLEISSDAVRIAAAAAGAGLTGGAGSALAVGAGTGITVNADDVAINTAVVVRKFAQAIVGTTTSEVITHNLGTQDVTVGVYLASGTYEEVECDIEHTTTNTITLRFAVAPTSGQYRVVVHG